MKSLILYIVVIWELYSVNVHAQEELLINNLNYSIGYFADIIQFLSPGSGDRPYNLEDNPKIMGKIYTGYAVNLGYERFLNSGFLFSSNLYFGKTFYYYNDLLGLYWNNKKDDSYFIVEVSFSKDLLKSTKYSLLPILAPFYRNLIIPDIDYSFEIQDNKYILTSLPKFSNQVINDIGISLGVDLRRIFKNHLFFGISFRSNLVFNIGFETLYLAPELGIQF